MVISNISVKVGMMDRCIPDFLISLLLSYLNQCAQITKSSTKGDSCHRPSAKYCIFVCFILFVFLSFYCFIVKCRWWKKRTVPPWKLVVLHCHLLKKKGCSSMAADYCKMECEIWEKPYKRFWSKGELQWDWITLEYSFLLNNQSKCSMPHDTREGFDQ